MESSAELESADLSQRLDRINKLTEQLLKVQSTSAEAQQLAECISSEIRAARELLKPLDTQ